MGIEAKLDKLKDKLKDLIEERTWYADANPILNVGELDLKIRLALFLIDLLDGRADKAKTKYKLKEEHLAAEEKEKERKFLEDLEEELKQRYIDWITEQKAEAALSCLNHKNNQHTFVFVPFFNVPPPKSFFKPVPAPEMLEAELSLQFNNTTNRRYH